MTPSARGSQESPYWAPGFRSNVPLKGPEGTLCPCSWVCMTPDTACPGIWRPLPVPPQREGPPTPRGLREEGKTGPPGRADAKTPSPAGSPQPAFRFTAPVSLSSCSVYRPVGPSDSALTEAPLHLPKGCSSLLSYQPPVSSKTDSSVWFMQPCLCTWALCMSIYLCTCIHVLHTYTALCDARKYTHVCVSCMYLCACTYMCTCMHTMYVHRACVCLHTRSCAGMHMLPAHVCAKLAQTDDSEAPVPHGYLNEFPGCPHGPYQRHNVRGQSVSPGRRHCSLSALGPATQHTKCPGTKANRRP